jgi:hypothetical protein
MHALHLQHHSVDWFSGIQSHAACALDLLCNALCVFDAGKLLHGKSAKTHVTTDM